MTHLGSPSTHDPLEREDRLLTRRQITQELVEAFGISQKFDTIRVLFKRFGITPLRQSVDPISGRGNVGLYDPLVVWVLAVYFNWPKILLHREQGLRDPDEPMLKPPPDQALDGCLSEARQRRGYTDDELTRRLAYYMFICNTDWGLDIRTLDAAIERQPGLLKMTRDDPTVLTDALRIYKRDVIERSLGRAVGEVDRIELLPQFEIHEIADEETGAIRTGTLASRSEDGPDFLEIMARAGLYDRDMDPTVPRRAT